MKRVLMVMYYFPPMGGIGSIRGANFARHLPLFEWEPTVLAPTHGAYHKDPSLSVGDCRVQRTRCLQFSRVAKAVTGQASEDGSPVRLGATGSRLRNILRHWLYRPDGQIGWYPFAVAGGRRTLMSARFSGIFSSSFPITSHLVARRLARDFQLPWIAEFRDPWADALPPDDPRRRAFLRWESSLIKDAQAVVSPSPSWGDLLVSKGARRLSVITNGCDPSRPLPPGGAPGVTLTHVGSFYPDRQDLSPLWPALAALRRSGELEPLHLRFVGMLPDALRAEVARHGLADVLRDVGFIPHARVSRELAAATILLVAGARDANWLLRGMIPAKVFEYLASGRPIIYVGDPRSDVATLLRGQRGCHIVPPGDIAAARGALEGSVAAGVAKRDIVPFTHMALTKRLADLLDAVAR